MEKSLEVQFRDLKSKHPDAVLLFRCGDFYETYLEDAEKCASVLGLTLTRDGDTSMAGFPYHGLDVYLPRLIRAGHRVAICDQLEMPKPKVKRGITELVQPSKDEIIKSLQEQLNDAKEEILMLKEELKKAEHKLKVI